MPSLVPNLPGLRRSSRDAAQKPDEQMATRTDRLEGLILSVQCGMQEMRDSLQSLSFEVQALEEKLTQMELRILGDDLTKHTAQSPLQAMSPNFRRRRPVSDDNEAGETYIQNESGEVYQRINAQFEIEMETRERQLREQLIKIMESRIQAMVQTRDPSILVQSCSSEDSAIGSRSSKNWIPMAAWNSEADWRKVEDRAGMQYVLKMSTWDVLVFLRTGVFHPSDEIFIVIVAIANLFIQSLFILLVASKLAIGKLNNERTVQQLQDWRVKYAHDPKYADDFSSMPLAQAVCEKNPLNMEGAYQTNIFVQLDEYLENFYGLRSGEVLCMLALALWTFTCAGEFGDSCRFLEGIWARTSRRGEPPQYTVRFSAPSWDFDCDSTGKSLHVSFSFVRSLGLTLGVFLPKAVVILALGYAGVSYLVATINLPDLFLNAVAVEVVLHVDEMLFGTLIPKNSQKVLHMALPLPLPSGSFTSNRVAHYAKAVVVVMVLVLIRVILLGPSIRNLEDAHKMMCDGSLDFLAFVTAVGPVAAGKALDTSGINRSSYAYRSILQRTGLQGRCNSSCLYMDSDRSATPFPIRSVITAKQFQSFSVRDIAGARVADSKFAAHCWTDLTWVGYFGTATDGAIFEAIKDKVDDPHASSCVYLKNNGWCLPHMPGGAATRFFCPVACGLSNSSSGNRYVDPLHGVPVDCDQSLGRQLINSACEDMNISIAQSEFETFVNATNQAYSELFHGMSAGNATHHRILDETVAQFATFGCPWLVHWDDRSKYLLSLPTGRRYNVPAILCSTSQTNLLGKLKTARYLCPVTCGCTSSVVQAGPGQLFVSVASYYKQDGKDWTRDIGVAENCPRQCFSKL